MNHVYIDTEFDAVRYHQRFQQAIISIGAVIVNDDLQQLATFYALVKPQYFVKLSPVVKRMTHLNDSEILAAKSLEEVVKEFLAWLSAYETDLNALQLYGYGPDDRRTLMKNCEIHNVSSEVFKKIIDLQKMISCHVLFQERIVSTTLSLEDLKAAYAIEGIVDHNALSDAIDLMKIHVKYVLKEPVCEENVAAIMNRKIQKEIEGKRKQALKLKRLMKERFRNVPKEYIAIPICPEVVEHFQAWEERISSFPMKWQDTMMKLEHIEYEYCYLTVQMKVDTLDEIPSVTLHFQYHEDKFTRKFPLQYRNATIVENILKQVKNR